MIATVGEWQATVEAVVRALRSILTVGVAEAVAVAVVVVIAAACALPVRGPAKRGSGKVQQLWHR